MGLYWVFNIKEGSGVLVITPQQKAKDAISLLEEKIKSFYHSRDFYPIKETKKSTEESTTYLVYADQPTYSEHDIIEDGELVDRVLIPGEEPLFARVNIKHLEEKEKQSFPEGWDFKHSRRTDKEQKLYAYFNVLDENGRVDDEKSLDERKQFREYLKLYFETKNRGLN